MDNIKLKIREEYSSHFELAEELLKFSFGAFSYKKYADQRQTQDIHQAVAALFVKGVRLLKSTILLVEQGLISESLAINRIAFESFLYLMWINKARDLDVRTSRCRDLLAWHVLTRGRTVEKVRNESYEKDIRLEESFNKIQSHLKILESRMSEQEWDSFKRFGPYGNQPTRKIERLAGEVGMSRQYNLVYKIGSEVIHCQDLLTYTERNPTTHALVLNGFDNRFIKASLNSAIEIHFNALSTVSRILRLNLADKLKVLKVKLKVQGG